MRVMPQNPAAHRRGRARYLATPSCQAWGAPSGPTQTPRYLAAKAMAIEARKGWSSRRVRRRASGVVGQRGTRTVLGKFKCKPEMVAKS